MSDPGREDDRLRRGFGAPVTSAAPREDCADDEAIWNAARGELDAARASEVLDHVATCAVCAESWRMAQAIEAESAARQPARVVRFPARRVRTLLVFGTLAAGLFLAAILLPRWIEKPAIGPVDEFRDPTTLTIESLLDERQALDRNAVILRWSRGPAGTLYEVEVATETLTVIDRSGMIEHTEYRVPAEVLAGLPEGATVYWRVDAVLPDASRASSPVFLVTLR